MAREFRMAVGAEAERSKLLLMDAIPRVKAAAEAAGMVLPDGALPFAAAMCLGEKVNCRQIAVLHVVAANPGKSVLDIAATLRVSKPSVTRALDVLAYLGLVQRTEHETDGRRIMVHATDAAAGLVGC